MTTLISDYSPKTPQSLPLDSSVDRWLFSDQKLAKIAEVFGVSKAKIENLSGWALQNRCFRKILNACERNDWEKLNPLRKKIFEIRNSVGKTISDVLVYGEDAIPNFCTVGPENLVFQGGGPKGIAYIGALKVLEKRNLLSGIKRVAGTSAGALTAMLVAFGYSSEEVYKFLVDKPLTDFLDFSLPIGGFCKGAELLNWINQLLEQRTGIPNCTFGELRQKIKNGEKFKHLHVFSIKVGANREAVEFNSEDKRWDNLIIADAVRASMSLPVVYPPYTLHFKNPEDQTRYPVKELGSFMDGGLSGDLINLAIDAFDKKRYIMPGCSELEGNFSMTNKRTLAFSLYTPGTELPTENTQVNCIATAGWEWCQSVKEADLIYIKTKPYDCLRTIKVSNTQVGTVLGFFEDREKLNELIQSGEAATNAFFQEQEDRLERLKTFSEDPKKEISFYKETKVAFYHTFKNNLSRKSIIGMEIVGDNISFHTDYRCSGALLINPFRDQFSFTKLAALDDRFSIFTHLRKARAADTDTPEQIKEKKAHLESAESLYIKHESFYRKCFYWDIFRKLIIERNIPEYINFFLSRGFSFSSSELNPMWYAYQCEAFKSCEFLLNYYATFSVEQRFDLTVKEAITDKTLLYYIAKEGRIELAKSYCKAYKETHPKTYKLFLDHEVNSSAGIKKTAFVIALEKENFEVASFLITEGADYLKHGYPLLLEKYQCCCNNMSARYFLFRVLSGDVERDLSPEEKMKALDFCSTYSSCGGVPDHEHKGTEWDDFGEGDILKYTRALGKEYAEKLIRDKIINSQVDDITDSQGNSLFFEIIKIASKELIELLLNTKYVDYVNLPNFKGETPLIYATKCDGIAFDLLLPIKGIQVNFQDAKGNTALHYAVSNKNTKYIESLLSHQESDPNLRNNLGQTPLHFAHEEHTAKLLIQAGAEDSIADNQGITSQVLRKSLMKPEFVSAMECVIGGMYKEIHESNTMSIGMKIATGSLVTILQPLVFPFMAASDAYSSIKHAVTDDESSCNCHSCIRQRNIHKLDQ